MFNVNYDSVDTIKQIRAAALANQLAGIVVTQFISEGTQFNGVMSGKTSDILYATELFLDEYYGRLVIETTPNFLTR